MTTTLTVNGVIFESHRFTPNEWQSLEAYAAEVGRLRGEVISPSEEVLSEGAWRPCTGCHESNEGHPTGPFSTALKCNLGSGCHECGGIGAVWELARESAADNHGNATPFDSFALPHGLVRKGERVFVVRDGIRREIALDKLQELMLDISDMLWTARNYTALSKLAGKGE